MSSCTYKFKNASGEEVTIAGQAEMKAFLANGGLEQLLPGKVLPWRGGSAKADDGPKSESPFAAYDDVARTYGYEVREDGAVGSDGKFPGVTIKVKGGRLRVESSSGNLLGSYPAKPESIGKFLESFWYAEKVSSDKPAPAESPKVEAKPALSYIQPSKVDTPAQGALANAIEQKSRAWSQVKTLRSRVKDGETHLRVDLLKAEDMWREAKRYEADAREQIEVEANKQGMTTKRDSGPLYEVDQNGDPSPEEAEAVQRGLQGKNPIEAAAWLAENAPPQYATIAAKVHDKLQDLSSNFGVNFGLSIVYPGATAESELSVARGATIPVQQDGGVALRIVLNGAGMKGRVGTSYRTALHELAHAATMQSVQLGHKGFPQYAQSVRDLVDVANAINRHMGMRAKTKPAELTDFERSVLSGRSNLFDSIDEVLVWGMTSPDAQAYLESIPYNSKSLWTAFVAAVRKVLGLSESNDTALSEILRISEVLMKPLDVDGSAGFARLNSRYEIQQPHGGRAFRNPGGVDDATWTGEAVDEGAARSSALVASIRAKSESPAVLRNDYPDTITVDGVPRPTTNSKGQPIHPTEEGVRNFWRWFEDSRVVDAEGRPLVVYHGTRADFKVFNLQTPAANPWLLGNDNRNGIFFTTDPGRRNDIGPWSGAAGYAGVRQADGETAAPAGANVMPVFLSIAAPYKMTAEEYRKQGASPSFTEEVEALGYDGVQIDDGTFIAFRPEQIKSATGNTGAFDPANHDIRFRTDFDDRPARAGWSESRIDRLISEFAYDFDGRRTKAYAAFVKPDDFLSATTPKADREKLESEATPLDRDGLASEKQPIFLRVRETDEEGAFQIVGHEGRHRMMALRDAGYDRIPVVLILPDAVYDAETIDEPYFLAQKFGDGTKAAKGFDVRSATPITSGSRAELIEEFSSRANGTADIRFRTDTQAFREWFGNSKMTNKAGEPLLFMHGSPASFEAFDSSRLGTSSSHTSSGLGHFFTRDRATAEKYADGGNIYTGWLRIEKPYVMMLEEAQAFDNAAESAKRRAELQKQGYDGAVILDDEGKPWATVAFEPWQFKSTDNNGSFDEFDDRMRFRDDPSSMRDAPAVPRDQAEEFIRKFVAEYPGAPQIMLADSFYQLPEDIQADALAQGSGPTRAKGALKNGKAYVVLNTHTSMADLEASVFHEVLGHAGIRKLLGPAFAQELNKMFIGLGGYSKLYQIMSRRGMGRQFEGYYDAVQRAREKNPEVWTEFLASSILTEEVFAHIAEQKNAKALRDRFMALVGMVRDWLRRNGFAKLASLGESDIVFLLQRARAGMKDGSGVMRDGVTVGEKAIVDSAGRTVAKEGSPDYEMLKVISERLGMRETNGPTVFSNSLPEEGKPGDDARMDDANNVAGKQAPTPAGDVEAGGEKFIAYNDDDARDEDYFDSLKERAEKEGRRVLFHVSPEKTISGIGESGGQKADFGGLFALENYIPGQQDHYGKYLHEITIDEDARIATEDDIRELLESGDYDYLLSGYSDDENDIPDLRELVADGISRFIGDEDAASLLSPDPNDAEWVAQALRAKVAKDAGFAGLAEEDGTLIFPGDDVSVKLSRVQPEKTAKELNESPASASSDDIPVFRTVTPEQLNAYAQPRGTVAREAFNNVVSAFKQPSAKVFGALHKTIATQLHKAWVSKDYAKVFGLADSYERDISRFSADPATVAPNLLPSFDSLAAAAGRMIHGNKNAKIMDGVAEAIIAGTLAGEDVTSGRVWTDSELRNQFGLSEQQVGLYKESRAAIDASLDAAASGLAWQMVKNYIPTLKESVRAETGNAETIIDGAMRELEEELREIARFQQTAEREGAIPEGTAAKTIKKAKDVAEARAAAEGIFLRADALKTAGYAPLMRFGKYAVDVVETLPDGTQERLGFYKFETEIEAKFAADALKKKHPEADVSRSVMSEEAWKLYRGVDPELVSLFADKIDGLEGLDVQNEVLQEWYRSAVNDRSAFKRMIQRKGVEGFERDITRVVASFITSNARVAARQFNMGDISKEIADMQARKVSGDVVDEAVKLKEYMENPTEPFQGLKGWMFAWFLGGSVASAALNMTQPLMMTLPYLSQFGGRKAAASLAGATKEAMSGNVSDPELKRALARAAKDGKVDPQQVHHLYHEGMSSFLSKLPLGAGARERAQGFMTLWGYMFGAVENFNRRITFIAAYRMAKNDESLGNPYDFAVKAIDETQGIYNKANRPNWARGTGPFGAIGVAAFTFKQYSIGYIELLVRMAKSGRNGKLGAAAMLGLLVMLSGIQGFPGADDMEDIIDTVSQHLGYTGNSKLAIRNKLREVLGEEAGGVAMNGVLSLLPFDIGTRIGLGNLLPASAIAKPSEQNRGAQLAELFGPPLSMANQVIDASLAVESGGGAMSVAKVMAPVAFKNLMAAYDMADSGVYRDTRGRKVTDVSLADAMFKAGGFQPMSVSKEQKGARLVEMTGQRIRMVKAAINGMKARAIVENDNDLRQRAEAMRLDWNRKNPEAVIMPDAPSVMRRVKEMNTERRARLMKSLPKEYRRVAEGEMN